MSIYSSDNEFNEFWTEFITGLQQFAKNNPTNIKDLDLTPISSWNKGIQFDEETRQYISECRKGISANKGRNAPWAKNNLKNIKHRAYGKYEITDPNGNKEVIINLKQYCKIHNLNYTSMSSLSSGKWPNETYKGYKAIKLEYVKIHQSLQSNF